MSGAGPRPTLAILPWGDVIEDFLEPLGLDIVGFRDEMSGGWLFNHVDGLRSAGVDTAVVVVSIAATRPVRWTHRATGAPLWVLPATRAFRMLRSHPRVATTVATPLRALHGALRSEGCDGLLCQEYEYARFDECLALGRAMRIPVFGTFQGGGPGGRVESLVRRWTVRSAAGLVIGPEQEARRVAARYGVRPERVAKIANPLDPDACEPVDRERSRRELGFAPDDLVVAWHGRVSVGPKGLDVLAAAWRRLAEPPSPGPRRRLLLVGSGPDAEAFRSLLAPVESSVTWIDRYVLDRAQVRRWLGAADVYAFPSRHEGFPVAPIEALAAGLPLVAADAPGIREILRGGEASGGVIVPRGDDAALAREVDRLLADGRRRLTLSVAARQRARDGFSPAAVGRRLADFLSDRGLRARARR